MTLADKFRALSDLCLDIANEMDKKDAEMNEYKGMVHDNRTVLKQIGELINRTL